VRHGERIAGELGLLPGTLPAVDPSGIRNSFGIGPEVEGLTHRELQARRRLIRRRLSARAGRTGPDDEDEQATPLAAG
jgi:hypothetical protein